MAEGQSLEGQEGQGRTGEGREGGREGGERERMSNILIIVTRFNILVVS